MAKKEFNKVIPWFEEPYKNSNYSFIVPNKWFLNWKNYLLVKLYFTSLE